MKISAKFASECPTCGVWLRKGEQVEWARGTRAQHLACAAPAAVVTPIANHVAPMRAVRDTFVEIPWHVDTGEAAQFEMEADYYSGR